MTNRYNRVEPYVGVSGVVNQEQQHELIEFAQVPLAELGRKLALGVKATHKPQYEDIENKYGRQWYPVGNESIHALDYRSPTFNIAQTYFEPSALEANQDYPDAFMKKLNARAGDYLDAIQVDMLRYEEAPEKYTHVIRAMAATGLKVIIQCHEPAMQKGPQVALDAIKRAAGGREIGYVLFDASHGRGRQMNPDALRPFLEAAYHDKEFSRTFTNFGIAGGLSAEGIVPLLDTVLRDFPDVSWDAEGRLHDARTDGGDGSLNMDRTKAYLARSIELIQRYA